MAIQMKASLSGGFLRSDQGSELGAQPSRFYSLGSRESRTSACWMAFLRSVGKSAGNIEAPFFGRRAVRISRAGNKDEAENTADKGVQNIPRRVGRLAVNP